MLRLMPAALARRLTELLDLEHAPVAVTIHQSEPDADIAALRPEAEPAGCCFWAHGARRAVVTSATDHANCSVGSYTHGFASLADAAAGADTAALVGSGWVSEADLVAASSIPYTPAAVSYAPLRDVADADVVLLRVTASSLMALQGAVPDVSLVGKPQCQIVPLALSGEPVVSAGCAVSRARTGMPADELTCALPAAAVSEIVARLERSRSADAAVSAYADADLRENHARD
jgi:uncharacterized protein (DUF169 family)